MVESGNAIQPDVDLIETEDSLLLYVDLPGVGPGGTKVEVDENNILSLRAKSTFTEPSGELIRQVRLGDYYRAFQLGPEYDRNRISAQQRDGILVLTIPKKEEAKAKKIQIEA